MEGAPHAGRRAKRDRHPSLILEIADVEARHLCSCESPHGLPRRYRPGERHVRVQSERSPVSKLVVGEPRARYEVDRHSLGLREDDEPRFRVDRFENVGEARVGDLGRGRCQRERRGDLLQPSCLVGTLCRFALSAPTLDLLEGEACLVGEAPQEHDRRRIRLRDLLRPRDDEDELRFARSDSDRNPERRAKPQGPYPFEALASGLVLDIGYERHPAVLHCVAQSGEVVEGGFEAGCQDLGWGRARELETLTATTPEDRRVRAERRSSFGADRRRRALDVVREKARSNPQDSVEPSAGFALPLVQTRTLECLTAEARSQYRDLLRIRTRRSALVEEQAQGTHRFPGNQERHCDRAMRVQGQRRSVRKVAFERPAIVDPDRPSFAGRLGDRRPRGERKTEPRLVRRACNSRIHDDEVRTFDQPERGATSSDHRGGPCNEGLRDVGRRDRGREGRGELLQTCHVVERRLDLGRGGCRALAPEPKHDAHPDHAERYRQRDGPARHLEPLNTVVLVEDEQLEAPPHRDGGESRTETAVPDRDRDHADEERVDRSFVRRERGRQRRLPGPTRRLRRRSAEAARCVRHSPLARRRHSSFGRTRWRLNCLPGRPSGIFPRTRTGRLRP